MNMSEKSRSENTQQIQFCDVAPPNCEGSVVAKINQRHAVSIAIY
jgi:hypothetical protein